MEIDNPFKEEVSDARKLTFERPPSPHRGGRVPKMTDRERRLRRRRQRARIAAALDAKAMANG
jgi:hypothetical protein